MQAYGIQLSDLNLGTGETSTSATSFFEPTSNEKYSFTAVESDCNRFSQCRDEQDQDDEYFPDPRDLFYALLNTCHKYVEELKRELP